MITVTEAKQLIAEHSSPLVPIVMPLSKAAGLVLAEDVIAIQDIPAYPQSSMDGYAFAYEDRARALRISGEQAAGDGIERALEPGTAVRIFTGAAVPRGADTVVMQEKVERKEGMLYVLEELVKKGDHVRPRGSEIELDSIALPKHRLLTPPAIGFLAAIGISELAVIPSPSIRIIVTGNELLQPGEKLEYGKVFEASSFALQAALQMHKIQDISVVYVRDDLQAMTQILKQAFEQVDLVLMTGGVSVGDHDHTLAAAEASGVKQIFHKVKQKPGKPFYFGKKGDQCFFGLPGNPASVLTCFYEYVLICLSKMTGRDMRMKESKAILQTDLKKAAGLTHFLRAFYEGDEVRIGAGQESYKLSSFATANCLVVLPEEMEQLGAGAEVDIHLLPQG